MERRISVNNKFFLVIALFILACAVKWFYLAHQDYYVSIHGEYPFGCRIAYNNLKDYFSELNWTRLARGPISYILWALSLRLTNFNPLGALYVGIFIGSVLVPVYCLIISELLDLKTAVFSSIILIFLTTYIELTLPLTSVILGLIFLSLSFLSAIYYYKDAAIWKLYLSGILLAMSIWCRYENALFLPFFVVYNLLFGKITKFRIKIGYWIICTSTIVLTLLGNLKLTGNPFAFIVLQNIDRSSDQPKQQFIQTSFLTSQLLCRLIPWPLWILGIMGIFFVVKHKGKKSFFIIVAIFAYFSFLFYKIMSGTLTWDSKYFFICALISIPLAFGCIRAMLLKFARRGLIYIVALVFGFMTFVLVREFNQTNLQWESFKYPKELIEITEDLKHIPNNYPLYICPDLNEDHIRGGHARSILYYLSRNPIKYSFSDCRLDNENEMRYMMKKEASYFLLIDKNGLMRIVGDNKYRLVKDYNTIRIIRNNKS